MTEPEATKDTEINVKLKAKMASADELNYTIQVYPSNLEWSYLEPDSEYKLHEYRFKAESIRQIVRNVLFKFKEIMIGSIRVGSKDFLFEIQAPKRIDTEKLKEMFTLIASEINREIQKSRTELASFKQFLDDSEF
jgi:hypothetical protein